MLRQTLGPGPTEPPTSRLVSPRPCTFLSPLRKPSRFLGTWCCRALSGRDEDPTVSSSGALVGLCPDSGQRRNKKNSSSGAEPSWDQFLAFQWPHWAQADPPESPEGGPTLADICSCLGQAFWRGWPAGSLRWPSGMEGWSLGILSCGLWGVPMINS